MRRLAFVGAATLVVVIGLAVALTLAGVVPAGDDRGLGRSSFGLERARAFDEFPLYSPGERVEGLPLSAVMRRDDTADYVSFVYGDCAAGDDAGCAPPIEVQVWPACRRNLALYEPLQPGAVIPERVVVRGVPAAFFDEGSRLELQTGRSTIVVFADSRTRALRVGDALRAVDGSVRAGEPLPQPTPDAIGGAMDC